LQADGYYLDVATDTAFTSMVVTSRDCGNHEYSLVTGLTTVTTYYYRVRAYNSTGTSGNSNTITAVTL
jgi:phosphodiesterase/alkaline phosphatase D-like protein